nr:Plug domain-containing protein [Pedomonas mirosovicensis]
MRTFKRAFMAAALPAMCLFASSAYAENAVVPEDAASAEDFAADNSASGGSDIIVTGTARAQRRFDASYSINLLTNEEIDKIAPVNMADLIGQLPGFQTESTGGEVQNIYRIRGLPSDGGFVNFQQDGLPLFHENDGYFFRGDSLARYDLMVDRMEVLRGGPASVYASYAGAIVNNITVTGSDTPAR